MATSTTTDQSEAEAAVTTSECLAATARRLELCAKMAEDDGDTEYEVAFSPHDSRMAAQAIRALLAERMALREALAFYADPETYFAIAVLADRPCGEFADDFSEVWWEPVQGMEEKPGKRAREVLGVDYSVSLYEAVEEARARSALQGNGGG